MDLIICLRNRKQTLTMNSTLTVYLVSEHLSVDHPVGHVEDVASQSPGGLLVWVQDSLASYSKAHQNHKHDDHEVQHVNHLHGETTERLSGSTVLPAGLSASMHYSKQENSKRESF